MSGSSSNILFITSDQHSHRYLGNRPAHNGGEDVDTPTLDQLEDNSTSFDSTYCATPLCTPSRLSLLTGKRAPNADAWGNSSLLQPDLETFPETLSNAGYETCLIGKMHLGGNRQFAGFDHRPYGDLTGNTGHQMEPPNRSLGEQGPDWEALVTDVGNTDIPESLLQERNVIAESMSFLREHEYANPDQPWALCASFSRPHWPRTAPERFFDKYWQGGVSEPRIVEGADTDEHPLIAEQKELTAGVTHDDAMRARAAYFACVEYLDELIGDFLAALDRDGFLDDTIVVYTSDHGEMAGEHGLWDKCTYHESSTRVPLFVQTPEHRTDDLEPSRFERPVNLIDLYPTLCNLVGVTPPKDLDGTNLSASIVNEEEPERGPVMTDCFATPGAPATDYRMVRDGDYKYVRFRDAPELLFNVEEDPLETENLAEEPRDDDAEALESLRNVVRESLDFEETLEQKEKAAQLKDEYRLGAYRGGPNQYHLPDGRVIDADTPIYHPDVVAEEPDVIFDDFEEP
ncbi:sulfatase-like hydrolase/transferase [Halobellus salinisoli]|uniref:sulfatase-like hydrolase/transferase n=1 Tax=Halobellus salinisoli TaxID=3108500 RepID=UPI0030087997